MDDDDRELIAGLQKVIDNPNSSKEDKETAKSFIDEIKEVNEIKPIILTG